MREPNGLTFLDFQLDTGLGELRKNGVLVPLEPKVLDLIAWFASHPGQLLTRDDLIEHVWGGRIVSDSAISSAINAARVAVGDDGSAQRVIKTIPRRGFRFVAEVGPPDTTRQTIFPDKPSVAVLPFDNLSGDPEQVYFSDGITDDIITDLSRYEELFVSARHSSFAYRGTGTATAEIARELGVQFIVEGNVRRARDKIRVTARLTDPWAGAQLWAERYDRDLTDIFEVQDEITSLVVNTLSSEITRQHFKRSLAKSADTISAYDHVLRSLNYVWKFDPNGHRKAIEEAELALALDPTEARAHAMKSWAYLHLVNNAFSEDPVGDAQRCGDAARTAVAADDREPWAHTVLGWAYQWLDRSTDRALIELDRAVSLNPSSAYYRSLRAFSLTYAGQSETALAELSASMRLYPHFPVTYHLFYGRALFNLHRYSEALTHLERVRAAQPNHPNALAIVAANYAANGQEYEARATANEVQFANPKYTISHARRMLPYVLEDDLEHFLAMLERADLPT